MKEKDLGWTSPDGIKFFAHMWMPDDKTKACITLVHGFGEHCMRYTPYFKHFTGNGIAVLGFDLRGHGQTGGKRGVIKSYEALMDDIETAISKAKKQFPEVPHFIYGHSMGGNLALNYLIRRKPDLTGGIIGSPWLVLDNDPGFIVKSIASFLKHIFPDFTIDSKLENNYMSTDESEVKKYMSDPLNHGRISLRLFSEITKTGLWAVNNTEKLEVPVLLMHGDADKITSFNTSKLAAKNSNGKIEFIKWEGKYHELHNETNREEVAKKVIEWTIKRI